MKIFHPFNSRAKNERESEMSSRTGVKIATTRFRRNHLRTAGYTLIEMALVIVIGVVLMGSAGTGMTSIQKGLTNATATGTVDDLARRVLERIVSELRRAQLQWRTSCSESPRPTWQKP